MPTIILMINIVLDFETPCFCLLPLWPKGVSGLGEGQCALCNLHTSATAATVTAQVSSLDSALEARRVGVCVTVRKCLRSHLKGMNFCLIRCCVFSLRRWSSRPRRLFISVAVFKASDRSGDLSAHK